MKRAYVQDPPPTTTVTLFGLPRLAIVHDVAALLSSTAAVDAFYRELRHRACRRETGPETRALRVVRLPSSPRLVVATRDAATVLALHAVAATVANAFSARAGDDEMSVFLRGNGSSADDVWLHSNARVLTDLQRASNVVAARVLRQFRVVLAEDAAKEGDGTTGDGGDMDHAKLAANAQVALIVDAWFVQVVIGMQDSVISVMHRVGCDAAQAAKRIRGAIRRSTFALDVEAVPTLAAALRIVEIRAAERADSDDARELLSDESVPSLFHRLFLTVSALDAVPPPREHRDYTTPMSALQRVRDANASGKRAREVPMIRAMSMSAAYVAVHTLNEVVRPYALLLRLASVCLRAPLRVRMLDTLALALARGAAAATVVPLVACQWLLWGAQEMIWTDVPDTRPAAKRACRRGDDGDDATATTARVNELREDAAQRLRHNVAMSADAASVVAELRSSVGKSVVGTRNNVLRAVDELFVAGKPAASPDVASKYVALWGVLVLMNAASASVGVGVAALRDEALVGVLRHEPMMRMSSLSPDEAHAAMVLRPWNRLRLHHTQPLMQYDVSTSLCSGSTADERGALAASLLRASDEAQRSIPKIRIEDDARLRCWMQTVHAARASEMRRLLKSFEELVQMEWCDAATRERKLRHDVARRSRRIQDVSS